MSLPRATVPGLFWPRWRSLRNTWRHAGPGMRLTWAVLGLMGLAFWAVLFGGLAWIVDAFYHVEVVGPFLVRKLLDLLLVALFAMLLFSSVVTALSTFFLSDDLELLLALPIPRPVFHWTRLLEAAASSGWMVGFFGLPVFLAYGLVHGAGAAYYLLAALVMACFLLVPAAVGSIVAAVLVNVFPARRVREALVFVGLLFLVALFLLLRVLRPERLLNAEDFQSLAAYVAEIQAPIPDLLPPAWASEVLVAALQGRALPWEALGLLVTGALAAVAVSRWCVTPLYDSGWTRSQEAREARLARSRWLDRLLGVVGRGLPRPVHAIVAKDVKVFFRDPAQWSQLFLLASLVAIYLVSVRAIPLDVLHGAWRRTAQNALAFLNLGMSGFVMAGLAVRFQYTAVSAEGRAFWILRTAPIEPVRYLWAKALPGLLPMALVGEVLIVSSNLLLGSSPRLTVVGSGPIDGLFPISGT